MDEPFQFDSPTHVTRGYCVALLLYHDVLKLVDSQWNISSANASLLQNCAPTLQSNPLDLLFRFVAYTRVNFS